MDPVPEHVYSNAEDIVADCCLHHMLSAVLEGQPPTLSSIEYYARLVSHIVDNDPATLVMAMKLVARIRDKYRTPYQYLQFATRIPVTKDPCDTVTEMLEDNCAICQKALRGGTKLVRLRGEQEVCGHFFHGKCIAKMQACAQTPEAHKCPLCRAKLSLPTEVWDDHENHPPTF